MPINVPGYTEGVEDGLWSASTQSKSQLQVVGGNKIAEVQHTDGPIPPEITEAGGIGTSADYIPDMTPAEEDPIFDSQPGLEAAVATGGTFISNKQVVGRLQKAGTYLLGAPTDIDSQISWLFEARGGIVLRPMDNFPLDSTLGAGAATKSAMFHAGRRSPASASTLALAPRYVGFNIDARGTTQTNLWSALRTPNPNPDENSIDPAPDWDPLNANKDYVAGVLEFCDFIGVPNHAWDLEAGNGRAELRSARALNCGSDGWDLGANDIVAGGHWASGGCNGFGTKVGNASGFFSVTGNHWGKAEARSTTVGAFFINQRKLYGITVSEFNDWFRFDGGTSFWRGGVVGLCSYAPFNEIFSADGVALDFTPGGDDRLQAHNGVTEYWAADFIGNKYSRTTATNKVSQPGGPFGTWMNIGGDLTGKFGTAFRWFIDASSTSFVNSFDQVNSGPNVKPWTGPQTTVTISIASPAVFTTASAHSLRIGDRIAFYTDDTLPTGLEKGVWYFIKTVPSSTTFTVSDIPLGTATATTLAGTGTHKYTVLSVPYHARGSSTVNFAFQDSFEGEFRVGTVGAKHSKVILGADEGYFGRCEGTSLTVTNTVANPAVFTTASAHGIPNGSTCKFTTSGTLPGGLLKSVQYWLVVTSTTTFTLLDAPNGNAIACTDVGVGTHTVHAFWRIYQVELGDSLQPSNVPYRNSAWGMFEFANAVQYMDDAYDGRVLTAGQTRIIQAGQTFQRLSVAGGGIANAIIQLPTDMKASYDLELFITGGAIAALSWTVSGTGSVNANTPTLPTYTQGFTYVKLKYVRDQNAWYVQHMAAGDRAGILGRVDAAGAQAGIVGEVKTVTVLQGSAVALTTATTADVTSLALTAGNWRISWACKFRGVGATCTQFSSGVNTSSATLAPTKADQCTEESIGSTAFAGSVNIKSHGGSCYSLSVSAATTVYLSAQATFSAGTMSAFGHITAVRVS